jgi:hypothetical protein
VRPSENVEVLIVNADHLIAIDVFVRVPEHIDRPLDGLDFRLKHRVKRVFSDDSKRVLTTIDLVGDDKLWGRYAPDHVSARRKSDAPAKLAASRFRKSCRVFGIALDSIFERQCRIWHGQRSR